MRASDRRQDFLETCSVGVITANQFSPTEKVSKKSNIYAVPQYVITRRSLAQTVFIDSCVS